MAIKKQVDGRSYPHMYDVTMAVGSRKSLTETTGIDHHTGETVTTSVTFTSSHEPNRRDDVMLVQYLLKRIYQQGHNAIPPLDSKGGATELKIDGFHGPKTQKAIESFQLELRRNGRNIATDGCVDPDGNTFVSSITKTGYTIAWLNKYFWLLNPSTANNIAGDPECPSELKLFVS